MKKKILLGLSSIAFVVLLVGNVVLAKSISNNDLTLSSLLNVALAECEQGTKEECPYGSCVHYYPSGSCCEACCKQEGEHATCGQTGCACMPN